MGNYRRMGQKLTVFLSGFEGIAHLVHQAEKFCFRDRSSDGPVNGIPGVSMEGRLSVLLGLVGGIVLFLSLGIINDGEPCLPAQPIRYIPHLLLICLGTVILIAICKGYGIDDKMIVVDSGVAVGGNHDLKAVAPQFLCQSDANFMGLLGGYFSFPNGHLVLWTDWANPEDRPMYDRLDQLKELQHDGLINRHDFKQIPPKVEYSLTELGESLNPIIESLRDWGNSYKKKLGVV